MSEQFDDETTEQLPTLEDALAEMTSGNDMLPGPNVLYGLSGLTAADMAKLQPVWDKLDATYQRILMQMLVDASETNFELNYKAIGQANLNAAQPEVRQAAIEVLWENESLTLMDTLIQMVRQDEAVAVRAEAAKTLGRFVLLGELGDLPENDTRRAQDVLISILNQEQETVEVRRYALESIANCTRKEVRRFIEKAYKHPDSDMRSSALVAMGRSCDAQRWQDVILKELDGDEDMLLLEAVRAAGELQLDEAVGQIIALLPDANRDMLETIIWALGEIGGKQAIRTLEILSEQAETDEDNDLLTQIDDAMGNASLASGDFVMLDFGDVVDD